MSEQESRELEGQEGVQDGGAVEAVEMLGGEGKTLNTLRITSFPFTDAVGDFIDRHDRIFVVEQNRDGQMRTLIINELGTAPDKLISIPHMDGTPPHAASICQAVTQTIKGGAA